MIYATNGAGARFGVVGLCLNSAQELVSLVEWGEADFPCITEAEIDVVAHCIVRTVELLKRMREKAEI
jgi:hypothetical protein